jgi:hypothetical protein
MLQLLNNFKQQWICWHGCKAVSLALAYGTAASELMAQQHRLQDLQTGLHQLQQSATAVSHRVGQVRTMLRVACMRVSGPSVADRPQSAAYSLLPCLA